MKARIPIAVAVVVTAGLVAAAHATSVPAPVRAPPAGAAAPAVPAAGTAGSASTPRPGASVGPASAGGGIPAPPAASGLQENLMTYAYAAADVADVEAGIDALAAAAESLTSGAEAWSLGRIRLAGETLRDRSAALERLVRAARGRMEPRAPRDPSLVRVWRDALSAYDLARRHADAAGQLAEFALTFDADAAAGAGEAIEGLVTAETTIATACADLRSLLGAWEAAHPGQAEAALSRYPR